jgi:predicted RNase H-like nuclease (RuvC/YqgF family)
VFSGGGVSQKSYISRKSYAPASQVPSQVPSGATSTKTSKTYIQVLELQLNEEKEARESLQREIEKLKKINSEISSKLGISIK